MKKSFKKNKKQTYLSHFTHECSDEELARDWTLFTKYDSNSDITLEKWILGKIKEKWMPKEIIIY